jgi:cytochrome c biogenesis protein CcmG/thiol:disulfide interchange protein DsbE
MQIPRLLLLPTLLLAITPCLNAQSQPHTKASTTLKSAPDFNRPDLTGKPIHLNAYRGKLVLLNFWATWCGPCLAEIPHFSAWQQKYASQGLQVLGISMDDDPAPVQKVYRKYQLSYPVVMGDEHLGNLYGGVLGLPITYLIDPQGRILAQYQGEPDLSQLELRLKASLPHPHQQ